MAGVLVDVGDHIHVLGVISRRLRSRAVQKLSMHCVLQRLYLSSRYVVVEAWRRFRCCKVDPAKCD